MATNLSMTGFRPWYSSIPAPTRSVRRRVASAPGTAIFKNDCMKRTAAGVWGLATAGAGVSGVSQGASYYDATIGGRRENTFLPVGTAYTSTTFDDYGNTDESFVYVTADPVNDRFVVQYSAGLPANADMTLNANFVANAGSTVSGNSGHVINQATLATTAALDFSVIDILRNVLSDPLQVNADVLVQINLGLVPPFNAAGTIGV